MATNPAKDPLQNPRIKNKLADLYIAQMERDKEADDSVNRMKARNIAIKIKKGVIKPDDG